jgi:predicted nucleic acid-binding protein
VLSYDTNILIYAFEGNSPWSPAAQSIVRLGDQDGAALSVLAWQELMTGVALRGDGLDEKLALVLHDFRATRFVPVTQAICERAVVLTRRYGKQVYGYDAIHLATALEHKAKVFVTNDKTLINLQIDGLDIRGL